MISTGTMEHGALELKAPDLTDIIFNDAYRYMVWLSTVPWLLIEILLVMKLDEVTLNSKVRVLNVGSAMMIASVWLLTIPLLLIKILLAMKLDEATFSSKA